MVANCGVSPHRKKVPSLSLSFLSLEAKKFSQVCEVRICQFLKKTKEVYRNRSNTFPSIFYLEETQTTLNLLAVTANPWELVGDSYSEVKMLPLHQVANQVNIICQLHFCKLILPYLFHNYKQALANAAIVERYLASVTGLIVISVFYFYKSLTQLALFLETPISEQSSLLAEVAENQKKLKTWAQFAPQNYSHKVNFLPSLFLTCSYR